MQYGNPALYLCIALIGLGVVLVRRRRHVKRRHSGQPALYLGLDCSTQSLTAIVIDEDQEVVCSKSVNFQEALPHYGTVSGVIRRPDNTVVAPTLMFIEALDMMLDDLRQAVDVKRIVAISGCAQQHGAVYWNSSAEQRLAALNPCFSLHQQLKDCFAITHPAIWMDSSTTKYCQRFEERLGGAKVVANLSGSRAFERFTGIQISKVVAESKKEFEDCARVSLLSSMLASLFIGKFAPIDQSDASGMNLMHLETRLWSRLLINAAAGNESSHLVKLLGEDPVPSWALIGAISDYFARRYGFSNDCQIAAFTGDNPSTLAGLGISKLGDVAISLGTSDTLFATVPQGIRTNFTGSILASPVAANMNMLMLCIKNGSLAREEIRNRAANGSWDTFSTLLRNNEPGNSGFIGFFYFEPEIVPNVRKPGSYLFDADDNAVKPEDVSPAVLVRALVESQFLSMRFHANLVGVKPKKIVVTGGASANHDLLTVCANVFNAPVYSSKGCPDAAALGSAIRAQHGFACKSKFTAFAAKTELELVRNPDSQAVETYKEMLVRFETLLTKIITTIKQH